MCAKFFLVGETEVVKNTVGQQHRKWGSNIVANQVSVRWNVDFNWTPYTHTAEHVY
jgi:hypothetical protein